MYAGSSDASTTRNRSRAAGLSSLTQFLQLVCAGNGSYQRREPAHVYPLRHHGVGGRVPQLPESDDCQPALLPARQQGDSSLTLLRIRAAGSHSHFLFLLPFVAENTKI